MLTSRSRTMATLVVAMVLLSMAAPAPAQTATTGAINGVVTDTSGADLPGVTVSIKSAALMGVQTAVTSVQGGYRFPSVPPGDYDITYELTGFKTLVRQGIRVGGAFTATVNVEMPIASLEETVTVTGGAPVVDVQATQVQTNFTTQQLESLPGARDMWAILSQAPAVRMARIDVGGANAGTQTSYSAYGGGPNRPMVEGMVMSQGSGGFSFMYYDYGSFEEVVVNTAGHGADMPAPGVQMQFIAKSGGNTLAGRFYADYENAGAQSHNVNAQQINLGAAGRESNRLYRYHFINLDSGGPITKDKIWWYSSFMDQKILARVPNLPVTDPTNSLLRNPTGKVTYQLSKADKLIAFYQGNYKYFPNRVDGTRVSNPLYPSVTGTRKQTYYGWVYKGEWDHTLNDRAFFELRAGQVSYRNEYAANSTDPQKEDLSTQVVTGGQLHSKPADNPTRDQVLWNLSVFKNGWGGSHSSHDFKVGGEFFKEFTVGGIPEDHVAQYFNSGVPAEVQFWQGPSLARSGAWVWSVYGNDGWNLGSRVALNLGVRYDGYQPFLPVQDRPASRFSPVPLHYPAVPKILRWNMWAPRFGLVYNVTGDGRSVVKLNAGKYWWTPSYDLPAQLNPNATAPFLRYTWTDSNVNGVWDPGEEGRLIAQGGGSTVQLDPNLKNTYSNEVSTSFEREVGRSYDVRTGFVWRGHRQQYQSRNIDAPYEAYTVPISVQDTGPDGKVGTADDGPLLTLYNLDPTRLGSVHNQITNVRGKNDYYTFEVSAMRRRTGRFNLVADYSLTWALEGRQPLSPNDELNTDPSDHRDHTKGWNAKIHSTIEAPWHLNLTPLLRYQSGDPWGRTFVVPLNYGTQTIRAERKSTRRLRNVTDFDLRLEKYFQVTKRNKISATLDIYNMFNANPEILNVQNSGATFLRPLSILAPRIVRFGTNVTW